MGVKKAPELIDAEIVKRLERGPASTWRIKMEIDVSWVETNASLLRLHHAGRVLSHDGSDWSLVPGSED